MNRSLDPRLVRRWLMALVALFAFSTLWYHISPPRITASAVKPEKFPGQSLGTTAGWSDEMQAVGFTQRRQLSSGQQLLLTNVASGTMEGFQVASLTHRLPALHLQNRQLFSTSRGQLALGTIQGRPAAQTCVIGAHAAVTGKDLLDLFPRERQFSSQWFAVVLGLRPPPIQRCMLVTLKAPKSSSGSASSTRELVNDLAALLSSLPHG